MKIRDILGGKTKRRSNRGPRVNRLRQEEFFIKEGGNAFGDVEGFEHGMIPDIMNTIDSVLSKINTKAIPIGSGATPTPGKVSGDLDVIVDKDALAAQFSMEGSPDKDIRKKLRQLYDLAGLQTAQSGVSVHVRVPHGEHAHQVDIMVVPHAELVSKFHVHDILKGSPYKGLNKQLAMAYLAKQQGLKWSAFNGLLNRETNELVSRDVNEIAKILIGKNANGSDLGSLERIIDALGDRGPQVLSDLKNDPAWKELPQ